MSNDTAPPSLVNPPAASRQADKPLSWALWLAILTLIGLLSLAVFAWRLDQHFDATRAELARRLTDSEAKLAETRAASRQNRETVDALQAKIGALEAQLAEMQSQQIALATIYQELSQSRDDRLLAEIEQELTLAAQQLQLAGNVGAALIALQGVEAKLARSAQPRFAGLRKLLQRDIERLKALPSADVAGIALKLDRVSESVARLPLAFEHRPAPTKKSVPPASAQIPPEAAPVPAWQGALSAWLGELWQELRQLVHIERIDTPDPGLLTPRESFFLRENLRLRLLSARLALLARDGRTYQADLQQASAWLEHYFDTRTPAVQEALTTLHELARLDVMRAPPELAETLAAVRNFKLGRERAAQ